MAETQHVNTNMDERIQEMVDEIRNYRHKMEALEVCVNDLKDELRALLESRGANWSDSEGYARLIAEGERTFYDAVALDEMIIADPLRYGWLKDYRNKSTVSGRVQVK